MFNQVNDSARKFAREFDNEDFRLVRSLSSFEKFANAENIELKSARGRKEGAIKKRFAFWSDKAGHGVIGDRKDVEKFFKLCEEEVSEKTEPAKRGRKPKVTETKEVSKRGRKPKSAVAELPTKKRGLAAIKDAKSSEKAGEKDFEKLTNEPDLELDVDIDYPEKHNRKELIKICKSEFQRIGIDADAHDIIRAFSISENIRQIFALALVATDPDLLKATVKDYIVKK